jgi:hypothetical protein
MSVRLRLVTAVLGLGLVAALPLVGLGQDGARAAPDQVMALLTRKLALTEDQAAKITPIIADRQQQLQALKADTSERPRQRMKKAQEILEDSDKNIKKLLTPDQVTQYDAIEQQMKERAKDRAKANKDGSAQ